LNTFDYVGGGNLRLTNSVIIQQFRYVGNGKVLVNGSGKTSFEYVYSGTGRVNTSGSAPVYHWNNYTGGGIVNLFGSSPTYFSLVFYLGSGNLQLTNSAISQFFNPESVAISVGGTNMALLAPVISQTASVKSSGLITVSCPGAAYIYLNSTVLGARSPSLLPIVTGDTTLVGFTMPFGADVIAYGTDATGNAGPTAYAEVY